MKFDAGTRTRITINMTLDTDPTDTTIELNIDGTWYPATWQTDATNNNGKWTRTARTTNYFAGPEANPGTATPLTTGRHYTQTRITTGTDILVADSNLIEVN